MPPGTPKSKTSLGMGKIEIEPEGAVYVLPAAGKTKLTLDVRDRLQFRLRRRVAYLSIEDFRLPILGSASSRKAAGGRFYVRGSYRPSALYNLPSAMAQRRSAVINSFILSASTCQSAAVGGSLGV